MNFRRVTSATSALANNGKKEYENGVNTKDLPGDLALVLSLLLKRLAGRTRSVCPLSGVRPETRISEDCWGPQLCNFEVSERKKQHSTKQV